MYTYIHGLCLKLVPIFVIVESCLLSLSHTIVTVPCSVAFLDIFQLFTKCLHVILLLSSTQYCYCFLLFVDIIMTFVKV